jgi:hypothetical protein
MVNTLLYKVTKLFHFAMILQVHTNVIYISQDILYSPVICK